MRQYFGPSPHQILASLALVAVGLCGCNSGSRGTQGAIRVPSVNAASTSAAAIQSFDKDGSGTLNGTELAACPAMLSARDRYDMDGDRQLSQEEIEKHITTMYSSGIGLMHVTCTVSYNKQPLADAKVRFVPEPFLGDAIRAAEGTTDDDGLAIIAIPKQDLPEEEQDLRAVHPGIYRVEIEHPSIKNLGKPLGHEVDPTSRGASEPVFSL